MKLFPSLTAVLGLFVFANAHADISSAETVLAATAVQPALMLDTRLSNATESTGSDATVAAPDVSGLNDVPMSSAINAEVSAGTAQERIYDGLLPGDDYTITMDSFPDQNGSTECVQLIKSLLAAPRTIFWKEGRKLLDHMHAVKPGTAIATFVKGQYPQQGRTGMHAAIFVRATQAGIFVLDQFRGRNAVTERFIPWHSGSAKRSNNASAYSTIQW